MNDNSLFTSGDLHASLQESLNRAVQEVENIPPNQFLNVSETDLFASLMEKGRVNPIVLKKDEMYQRDWKEVQVRRQELGQVYTQAAMEIKIVLPFEGDRIILQLRPNTYQHNSLHADVSGQSIVLTYTIAKASSAEIEQRYAADIQKIEQHLSWGAKQIADYNNQVELKLKEAISQRKQRLLSYQQLSASLNVPLKRASNPVTYDVPMVRRAVKISMPPATAKAFKPEPSLAEDEYQHILEIINNMSLVMERSPHTFAKLEEEEIRDHFLMHLNGHYEGRATGETFNGDGKTDILIRENGQNVFIAECALWKGDQYLSEKIEQLQGYKCWRDTKTAILLFSRNKDFSSVLAKIPEVVKSRANFKKEYSQQRSTAFRFLLHHDGDRNREFVLTVMAFNVPAASGSEDSIPLAKKSTKRKPS